MRELIKGADLAIANFENPAPNRVRWHTSGTVFSADPGIIDGLVNAGIDYVSLANNHIGDAGDAGILQTIDNLEGARPRLLGRGQGRRGSAQARDARGRWREGRRARVRRDRRVLLARAMTTPAAPGSR